MGGVIRRALGAGVLVMLLAGAAAATAAAPPGPRLAVFKASAKAPRFELVTINRRGGDPRPLIRGAQRSRPFLDFFSAVSWSPDGKQIAFSGLVGVRDRDDQEPILKIFTVAAYGSDPRPVPGTNGATAPIFSPDGQTLAFARAVDRETPTTVGGTRWENGFHGTSIWIVDLETGAQRQLTPWQDEVTYIPSSFSPDGTTLLATHEDDLHLNEAEPVALKVDGSGSRRLLDDGFSPVYSPDGSRIALIRRHVEPGTDVGENFDLYVIDADGGNLRRLTRTPGRLEYAVSWDPSGERLAYSGLSIGLSERAPLGNRIVLMQANADGSCKIKVVSRARTYFSSPAWQPGPGRGAGRIECGR
jgi:TolB protein